jgi:hypothetical protein
MKDLYMANCIIPISASTHTVCTYKSMAYRPYALLCSLAITLPTMI